MERPSDAVVAALHADGIGRGGRVAVALRADVGVGLAWSGGAVAVAAAEQPPAEVVDEVERAIRPRWVMWSQATAIDLVHSGVRVATAWDVAAVQRLLAGGWRMDPGRAWAQLHGLDLASIPPGGPPDLFSLPAADDPDPDGPVQPDGHLRRGWAWDASPAHLARWAELARLAAEGQEPQVAAIRDRPAAPSTARSESTAELLCAELAVDGLPVDRAVAEAVIAGFVGPRPRTEAEAEGQRVARDAEVLRHAPDGSRFDLRSPGQVKSLLRRIGIEVPDTRAWRLEAIRDEHPLVEALLAWRKAERVATTYGYRWLDEHLGADGRLHGEWSGADGAAGRMTASAGLHNMPGDMRAAVVAEPGHVFVRADLGQIEPRVLAAVSGDRALAAATVEADLYAPVATQLGVDRATAKVAVLGAMYGQTTGHGAQALRGLQQAYPVAMAYLDDGDRAGQTGRDLRTYGGRLVPMGRTADPDLSERDTRSRAAAMGRYGRNALVQGAAAELFKVWAVTVRARGADLGARIVLCLHDELLVHAPIDQGSAVATLLDDCLQEAAHRWCTEDGVRFVAEIAVIPRWSDAKA